MSDVLALKYRPQSFDEVIGQDTTVCQLKSALEKGNLGHALIFSGTRGSGKTTCARIVARELNKNYDSATKNWERNNQLIVSEIDAASNTGVDNVREIIENIRYAVQGHRVVILDEAHMLSKSACNALLKTLEEPPPGVTFILLTTEPNKLIATIRSRCQLYEFTDVSVDILKAHYLDVAEKEGLNLSEEAAQSIALKAEGSVRDGLTILQKYLSGEKVTDNAKQYFELVGAIYSGDVTTALDLVGEIRKSEEAKTIVQTLEKWFYWSSLEFFGQKTPIRDFFSPEALQQFDLAKLQDLFSKCLDIERDLYATPNSKVVLEMGIIKLTL